VGLISRTPRTVLGALVPGAGIPGPAARIPYVIRSREASSLHDLAQRARPAAAGRPRPISLVERGPRTLAPFPAAQIGLAGDG
jgi:hypothetical protein